MTESTKKFTQECWNCRYFRSYNRSNIEQKYGKCYRYPPQACGSLYLIPDTNPTSFCGEFNIRLSDDSLHGEG